MTSPVSGAVARPAQIDVAAEAQADAALAERFLAVVKSANESVNNASTGSTLQDDDELLLPLEADSTYLWECVIYVEGATAGDIKLAFTQPTSATTNWGALGPATAFDGTAAAREAEYVAFTAQASSPTSSQGYGVLTSAVDGIILVKGVTITGANAGNLRLQWAQNSANATNTTVFAGSYMRAEKVA